MKNQSGKNNYNWKGGRIRHHCLVCGKEFYRALYETKRGDNKFCSRKCFWTSETGKHCHFWKGGITPILAKIRNSDKYKKWRQDIFIRDNFICQDCGDNKGGNLEAHHKKAFGKLIEEVKKYLPLFNLYDGAMTYTPLWDLDNGTTLCEKCHKER